MLPRQATISSLIDDESLRARLGQAAAERSRFFSVARMAGMTAGLYLKLVEEKYPGWSDSSGATRLKEQTYGRPGS